MTSTADSEGNPMSLDTVTAWARSNREWDKVYQYLFHYPQDLFAVCPNRRWPIAHQIVYHEKTDLLKQVLALYSEDQIDINTKSGDDRTLLSVATEKRAAHPTMYAYVSRLFAQDELITAAKNSNWPLVKELLEKNKELANEKPPYSPKFLLHYIVQNGNIQILQEFLTRFQFLTTVLNSENERPFDMANRLGKQDMCSILRPVTARSSSTQSQPETSSTEPVYQAKERTTYHGQSQSSDKPKDFTEPSALPTSTTQPVNSTTRLPPIGFGALIQGMNKKDDETEGQQALINTDCRPSRPHQPHPNRTSQKQQSQSPSNSPAVRHVHIKRTIVSEVPLSNWESSDPPSSAQPTTALEEPPSASTVTDVFTERLRCPLTKKLFIDPVIASDSQTYERSAITEWVNTHHTSPLTGKSMDSTFHDNREIKAFVQLMQNQK